MSPEGNSLKRSEDRSLAPNLWTGIGGHIEDNEHNAPQDACLRGIYEETGITSTVDFVIYYFVVTKLKFVSILFILDIPQR